MSKSTTTLKLIFLFSALLSFTAKAQQWSNVRPGYGLTTGVMSHNNKLFSTSGAQGIYMSADNGGTWTQQANGLTGAGPQTKHLGKSTTHIYTGSSGGVYRSNDDGSTWVATDTIGNFFLCYGRYFYEFGGVTFCVSNYSSVQWGGGLFRSTDNGTTWTTSHAGIAASATPLQMAKVGTDLFIGTNLGLYKSIDNGVNWTIVTTPHNGLNSGLCNYNGRLIILDAHPSAGGVKYSDDGGATWFSGTSTIRGFTLCGVLEGSNDTLFAFSGGATTTASGIFYSIDSAKTWVDITGNVAGTDLSSLSDMTYHNGHLYLAYAPGVLTNANTTAVNETKGEETHISIYPNPASDFITLENEKQVNVIVKLVNAEGKIVLSETSSLSSLKLNLFNLPKGSYLIQVSSALNGNLIASEPVIVN